MILSPQQDAALVKVNEWLKTGTHKQQVFRLFGYAGSGKSSIARKLVDDVGGSVYFAAYTGKAALVMRQKGCPNATTIHSLAYTPTGNDAKAYEDIKAAIAQFEEHLLKQGNTPEEVQSNKRVLELKVMLANEHMRAKRPRFRLNTESVLKEADLLVIDECFPKGTLVDTPLGKTPIESVQPGTTILNAIGRDIVVATCKKEIHRACRINGETTIICSENHPVFTTRGVILAGNLRPDDQIVKTAEAVRLLRSGHCSKTRQGSWPLLQSALLDEVVPTVSRDQSTNVQHDSRKKRGCCTKTLSSIRNTRGTVANRPHSQTKSHRDAGVSGQNFRHTQTTWAQANSTRWKRTRSDQTTRTAVVGTTRVGAGVCGADRSSQKRLPTLLQTRPSRPNPKNSNRVRRGFALHDPVTTGGSKEGQPTNFFRVDSVEILEQGHPDLDQFRDASGKLYFYDLQAAQHRSYSVNGLLVHNCSMVDVPTGEDLESFGCPILVLGDPAQLQPVKGTGYFTLSNPDVMLTEIHRQAADNPIIRLATLARERKPLPLGQYGDSRVIRKSELREHPEYAQGAGIVLCGTHKTRIPGNARMRELAGRTGKLPQIGDKLVCSRNNKEIGLLNGGLWEVLEVHAIGEETMTVSLRSLDIPQTLHCIDIDALYFNSDGKEEMPFWETGVARFDYGYLLTVHRSQGSQWDDVLTIDESEVFRQDRYCHLYTAITRAAERTTIAV